MSKLTGLTVEQLIERLQKMPPKALIVTDAGEATVAPVSDVELGYTYRFANTPVYGMSEYLFTDENPPRGSQQTVYIGSL